MTKPCGIHENDSTGVDKIGGLYRVRLAQRTKQAVNGVAGRFILSDVEVLATG
jgi:hypothetical protein